MESCHGLIYVIEQATSRVGRCDKTAVRRQLLYSITSRRTKSGPEGWGWEEITNAPLPRDYKPDFTPCLRSLGCLSGENTTTEPVIKRIDGICLLRIILPIGCKGERLGSR